MNEMKSGPGWLGKIKNFLGNTFSLFALGGANGGLIVRRRRGAATNDEVQIWADGNGGNINAPNQTTNIQNLVAPVRFRFGGTLGGTPRVDFNGAGADIFGVVNAFQLLWSSGANPATAYDAGIGRAAPGVVHGHDGTNPCWFQNAAGRAVTTADVPESAAVLTSITGLSRDFKSGRKYTGQLVLKCVNSVAADGIQLDFNGGTATMTSFWAAAGVLASNGTDTVGANISTSLAGVINYTVLTGETTIVVNFSCVVNAGGTFIVRVAENAHTTGTLTLRLGSSIWAEDMP